MYGKKDCPLKDQCEINHDGSSGSMEKIGTSEIMKCLLNEHSVKVTEFLADGDSRAYSAACEVVNHQVDKLECINHLSKRMHNQLTNRVKECRRVKF